MDLSRAALIGITPAPAGTTFLQVLAILKFRDHPRTCGDHCQETDTGKEYVGSPPHLRGPQVRQFLHHFAAGITPAPAGTTRFAAAGIWRFGDHPRTCGDHPQRPGFRPPHGGSPPHLRGPRLLASCSFASSRITPAPAGTTYLKTQGHLICKDHPRTCGDHRQARSGSYASSGSPPHLRGPRKPQHHHGDRRRITPAPAGTTRRDDPCRPVLRDHPRTCGDHNGKGRVAPPLWGSPPHLRGPRKRRPRLTPARGITPAPAGTTARTDQVS